MKTKAATTFSAIILCIAGNLHAQDRTISADESALVKLEHEWMDAENRHDAKTLNTILDDKFVATFGTGKAIDKQTYLKGLTDGAIDPTVHQDIVNEHVVIDANTAVIVLVNTIHGTTSKDKPFDVTYRITVTFVRHGNQWNALALQGVSIK